MPFCPKCRYEYKPGITTCPDCEESLVDTLPEVSEENDTADEPDYDNWVQIARLTSPQFVEMVVEALRAKDIPAVIHSEGGYFGKTGQMGVHSFIPAGWGYTLLVPEEFVIDADREAEVILGDEWQKVKLVDIDGQ